ncbi:MAG: metal-dependent hydrolase [Patescibacteria group bacterium]
MILDIFLGALIAKLASIYFSVPLTSSVIIAGVIFVLLPDIDLLKIFFQKEGRDASQDFTHRDIFHYPLPYLILGTALVWFLGSPLWASIFFFASLLHFLHDSIGIGWGVKWLYPFSKNSFAFLYHYEAQRNNLPKKIIYIWSPEEVERLSRNGDKNWVKNIYFSFHPYSVAEHVITLIIATLLLFEM